MAFNVDRQGKVIGIYPEVRELMLKHNQHPQLVHASNLIAKCKKSLNVETDNYKTLYKLLPIYLDYLNCQLSINDYTQEDIKKRVEALDNYYEVFESLNVEDIFDSRSKIRSTILEEFMYLLLIKATEDLRSKLGENSRYVKCGAIKAYSNLYITGKGVVDFIIKPEVKINTKDQDYAVYRSIPIMIANEDNRLDIISQEIANVPIIAIENKTFLDKTMLEGSVATAEKVKLGNPYSTYIVVTETYAVDEDVDPIYSRIDQIFVLRKCKTDKDNRLVQPISPEIVTKIVELVISRFNREWSDVGSKIKEGLIM